MLIDNGVTINCVTLITIYSFVISFKSGDTHHSFTTSECSSYHNIETPTPNNEKKEMMQQQNVL